MSVYHPLFSRYTLFIVYVTYMCEAVRKEGRQLSGMHSAARPTQWTLGSNISLVILEMQNRYMILLQ